MAKNLMIVESPAKAKTLKKFLGKDFDIEASLGHIIDLPLKKLAVDVDNDFETEYVINPKKKKVVDKIRAKAAKAETVYLSPDPDREGEAIAWHLAEQIDKLKNSPKIVRAVFNEITPKAVREAVENPRELNKDLFDAQQARRILDRLVGFKISPILWKKVRQGLSAGRVQSVALRLAADREAEILAFVKEEYWQIAADAEHKDGTFGMQLAKIAGKKAKIKNEKDAKKIVDTLTAATHTIIDAVEKKERKRNPVPPFITSTLQQDVARKFRFTAKKTMQIAQQLYEGIELGSEGTVGLITYMRTDSVRVSDDAIQGGRAFIKERFGKDYLPTKPNTFKMRKSAQDAHEAIRPSYMEYAPDKIKASMSSDQYKLYSVIWNRFIASQMKPALFDQTTIIVKAGNMELRASGSVQKFDGFLAVYQETKGVDDSDEKEQTLPVVEVGDPVSLKEITPSQHFTQPPPRFTEATLIRMMEDRGIGRPSTYAAILSTLIDKKYVERIERRLVPTALGLIVSRLLVEAFSEIMDVDFTAGLEDDLDRIAQGDLSYVVMLKKFYAAFSRELAEAENKMPNLREEGVATDLVCPKCKSKVVIRLGRSGEFLACTAYPDCDYSSDFERKEDGTIVAVEAKTTGEQCPECGKDLVEKSGRYGKFLACTGYPDCRFTKPINGKDDDNDDITPDVELGPCPECDTGKMLIKRARKGNRFISCSNYPKCKHAGPFKMGVTCPDCGGDLEEKAGNRKVFYGCSGYPKCKHVSWNVPVAEACPKCSHSYMVRQASGKDKGAIRCPDKECGFIRSAEEVAEAAEAAAKNAEKSAE